MSNIIVSLRSQMISVPMPGGIGEDVKWVAGNRNQVRREAMRQLKTILRISMDARGGGSERRRKQG